MKKILLIMAVFMFAGCRQMNRDNPTDQLGTKYGGWTYAGEIGSFGYLTDFMIATDPADAKDYIFAVDGSKEEVDKYFVDGTPVGIIPNPATPVFFNPSGICEMNGYCYIIDTVSIDAVQIDNINYRWSDTSITGNKILSCSNMLSLYVVTSDPPGVAVYTSDVIGTTYSAVASWAISVGDTTCDTCMSYISDITVTATNEIMLVDSVLKRISIFTDAGVWVKNIDIGSDISSVAIWGDTLFVPTTDGIRKYSYSTRALIETIANYGEGNGRVTAPGPIELYPYMKDGKYVYNIYVGAGSFIKVFETTGF